MNEELIASLEELGLSQKEARVYLASLMIGPASVQRIADQSAIKRVTTYVILESLVNLGLVSQSTKGKKTLFIAEPPTSLRRLLAKKEEAIKDQRNQFESVLPQLSTLQNLQTDSPNVRFYDSPEGIKGVVGSFMSSHKDEAEGYVYGVSNLDQLQAFFPEIASEDANPDRVKAGLPSKFLYTTTRGPIMKASDEQNNRESRFVPLEEYPLNGDLSIVGDNLILLSLVGAKPIAVTIKSQELAKMMKTLFDMAWSAAEKYNKA